jgi:hypothetical protein
MGEAELAATGDEVDCDEALEAGFCSDSDGWNEAGFRVSVGVLGIGAEMEFLMGDGGFCEESFVRFFFKNQGERIEAEAEVRFEESGLRRLSRPVSTPCLWASSVLAMPWPLLVREWSATLDI